jgi:hypothetical protein
MPKRLKKTNEVLTPIPGYESILAFMVELVESARRLSARSVNSVMTATYWEVGRRIVESEQGGKKRAKYGSQLIDRLAIDLTERFGRGFSGANLEYMRRFYLEWTIPQTLSGEFKRLDKSPNKQPLVSIRQTVSGELVQPVDEKKNIRSMVFGGFDKCIYPVQKFDSDTERRFAVILENDKAVNKWIKPGKGNFQIHYSSDSLYEPDFVAETDNGYFLCEPKAENEMEDAIVKDKAKAAAEWCKHASGVSPKPWTYILIPHTAIDETKSLASLSTQFSFQRNSP